MLETHMRNTFLLYVVVAIRQLVNEISSFQGRSSSKIVGGSKVSKNVGHHGWPTETNLGFEWPKSGQMALKFFCFFRKIFKYVQDFSCSSILANFFSLQEFFFIKIQKIKKGSVQNETM